MTLTRKQYILLLDMVKASIERAASSGIPIGQEYYSDIDEIKEKLYQEITIAKEEVDLEFDA